jgi:large subunit ribosomal protein L24
MHIKKNDTVIVISGSDKGKQGKVLRAIPGEDKVVVEGINMKKVHQRSQRKEKKGEMIDKTFPIHVSNVKKVETK